MVPVAYQTSLCDLTLVLKCTVLMVSVSMLLCNFDSLCTGSASTPDCSTTNLHLDIADAVNVMVYCAIPEGSCDPNYAVTEGLQLLGCCTGELVVKANCSILYKLIITQVVQ